VDLDDTSSVLDRHEEYRRWLESALASEHAFGISDVVLSTVIRIVTHPKIFRRPSTLPHAIGFSEYLLTQPNAVRITPGSRHWSIFAKLCREVEARGNLISDAYLAALAIEAGAEWITTDRDFARFPGLRWRHPLR
jgi:hypothetical protein